MKIDIYKGTGKLISSYQEWENAYVKGKDGHSALEFGKFIMNHNGLQKIQDIIESSLDTKVEFNSVYIEKGVPFDEYQRESQRDMVINGTANNKNLFITIEAKASETFGGKINSEYKSALNYLAKHNKSKRAQRIKELYEKIIPEKTTGKLEACGLRYQLFHATAATAFSTTDSGIMMVIELKTNITTQKQLNSNKTDFCNYMDAINATNLHTDDFLSYDAVIFNKKIRCIYLEIDV